jgi:methylglutamate dehydrogenase subunit D
MSEFALTAALPFTIITGRHGCDLSAPGLRLQVLKPRAMVHVMARRNKRAELGRTVQTQFGVVLPDMPILARGNKVSLLWAGHHQWLALAADEVRANLLTELQTSVGDAASLSDQSDARFAVMASGPKVRDTLAKLTPIDLHPRVFAPSQTALTLFGHLTGQITQINDAPSYELMVFRSFAQCFWRAIHAAGAEFGIDVIETIG